MIKSFCGIIYNKEKIEKISDVLAPPYDVITKDEQKKFYKKHPKNVIRLILGKEYKNDNERNNRYTRARKEFLKFLNEGILYREKKNAIYVYQQTFEDLLKRKITRKGIIVRLKLPEREGSIMPFEKTFEAPKLDRLRLTLCCHANLCQIFMISTDKKHVFDLIGRTRKEEIFNFCTDDGIQHRFMKIPNENKIKEIEEKFGIAELLIADGHHRFETALNYRNIMRERTKEINDEPFNYTSVYITDVSEEGIIILPIHRIVKDINDSIFEIFLKNLSSFFLIEELQNNKPLEYYLEILRKYENINAFIVVCKIGNALKTFLIIANKDKCRDVLEKKGIHPLIIDLDTIILHRIIFEDVINLDSHKIFYDHNIERIFDEIYKFGNRMAFILNPVKKEKIIKVAREGIKMPHKSAFFYPKLLSGIVINPLWEKGDLPPEEILL